TSPCAHVRPRDREFPLRGSRAGRGRSPNEWLEGPMESKELSSTEPKRIPLLAEDRGPWLAGQAWNVR
ncbi:MAG: hypothetical protein LM598_06360, partial [Candidatus Verstraetearchaeota archaeon]|nr:hypothetical protein [Candidatus Verstraetearchaeota archaeon]